jgi:hypothetical protein
MTTPRDQADDGAAPIGSDPGEELGHRAVKFTAR